MANIIRYRKPSVKTILGVTKMKKRVKKALGINAVLAPFRMVGNFQRRTLNRAGYYSPEMKALRAAQKGQIAGPLGALQIGEGEKGSGEKGLGSNALLMAAMMSQGDNDKKGEGMNPLLMGAMLAGNALGGEGKGGKKSNAPGLAEALLLSAAMAGSGKEHESKAKRAAKEEDEPREEHPHATHARSPKAAEAKEEHQPATRAKRSKTKKDEEEKPRKGFRLFG